MPYAELTFKTTGIDCDEIFYAYDPSVEPVEKLVFTSWIDLIGSLTRPYATGLRVLVNCLD